MKNLENTSETLENEGKKSIKNEKIDLDANKLASNLVDNKKSNNKKNKRRRKNSQRKKEQKQLNIQNNNQINKLNINDFNNINNKLNNIINQNDLKIKKSSLTHDFSSSNLKNNKKLPPLPLRTMSIPELMSNSNEIVKAKRLQLTSKKNHSISFDQEKIRHRIHDEEWHLKTQKIFDYSKFNAQNDLKYLNEQNHDLGRLRKDSISEHYWSSRLNSHHSSSSEEWYREIHEKMRKSDSYKSPINDLDDITINDLESNSIVNKIIDLQNNENILEQKTLNENNSLDKLDDKNKKSLEEDDNKINKLDMNEDNLNDKNDLENNLESNSKDSFDISLEISPNLVNKLMEKENNKNKIELDLVKKEELNEKPFNEKSDHNNEIKSKNVNIVNNDQVNISLTEKPVDLNNKESKQDLIKNENHISLTNSKPKKDKNKNNGNKKTKKIKLSKIGKKCILMYLCLFNYLIIHF